MVGMPVGDTSGSYSANHAGTIVLDKPGRRQDETKALYRWRILRTCLQTAVMLVKEAEIDELAVVHGIHHIRQVMHNEPVLQVLHMKEAAEYLLYDGSLIRTIDANDGRDVRSFETALKFSRIVFVEHLNMFVGWTINDSVLYLLSSQFEFKTSTTAPGPLLDVVYNRHANEIVACGPGFIVIWIFRYGGRVMMTNKIISEGLSASDHFTMIAIESTDSLQQRAYAVNARAIAVFNIREGSLSTYRPNLHSRNITAMVVYDALKYLITACKDGTIKVWDDDFNTQLIFIGHTGEVTSLAIHPFGACLVSAGRDYVMRVWSLETCDQLEQIELTRDIQQICTTDNCDEFLTIARDHVNIWKIHHVYSLLTRVGHSIQHMTCTDHPSLPTRCVLRCSDASVRIINPVTGDVITTLLMTRSRKLLSSAYAISEDTLFAVFHDGTIVKADSCTNPCTIQSEWLCLESHAAAQCLLTYHYMISQKDGGGAVRRATITKGLPGGSAGRYKNPSQASRTLLLGGRKDGLLCVYNWDTGHVDYTIEAHDDRGVLSMCVYGAEDQLITAGRDMVIKIWRVYPFAHETLSLLTSFYCMQTPLFMSISNNRLGVAFQDHVTATYSVVLYHLKNQERYDHSPISDHNDAITGLASCSRLKLFASCSSDGTVRVWNYANKLIRVVKLHMAPRSISFCSEQGNLLIGIGDHLHRLEYKRYLPRSYLAKILAADFPSEQIEKPLPFDEDVLVTMSADDVRRLKSAHSSLRYIQSLDRSEDSYQNESNQDDLHRQQMFAVIQAREAELQKIRDGQLMAAKKPKPTTATKKEALNKYLKLFFDLPEIEPPDFDDSREDEKVKERLSEKPLTDKHGNNFAPELEPVGFFPSQRSCSDASKYRLPARGGSIPNSAVIKMLYPRNLESFQIERQRTTASYRPPVLNASQLAFISQYNQKAAAGSERSLIVDEIDREATSLLADYVETQSANQAKPQLQKSARHRLAKLPLSRSRSKLNDVNDNQQAADDDESEADLDDWISPKFKQAKEEAEAKNRIQSLLSKADTYKLQTIEDEDLADQTEYVRTQKDAVKERSLDVTSLLQSRSSIRLKPLVNSASATPSTPRQQTSLSRAATSISNDAVATADAAATTSSSVAAATVKIPSFVMPFMCRSWFDKYFIGDEKIKPWSQSEFVDKLVHILLIAECLVKIEILQALSELQNSIGLANGDTVARTIYRILESAQNGAALSYYEDDDGQRFVCASLLLLYSMGLVERQFYTELMLAYMEGNEETRTKAMDMFIKCGLKDANGFLAQELESWDVYCVSDERVTQLRSRCADWLDKWLITLQIHSRDQVARLKKNQLEKSLKRTTTKEQQSTSSLKRTVTVEMPDTAATMNADIMYIEAINYFCETSLTKKLLRDQTASSLSAVVDGNKNTVISLPRLNPTNALVRLGDSHTGNVHLTRQDQSIIAHGPYPGDVSVSWLSVPRRRIVLNPFPSPIDYYDPLYTDPLPLLLQTAQKYFIPARSYVTERN